jgi:hypothetical protein
MTVAGRITALVEALRRESFESMAPADRRQLVDLCRTIADKAEPKTGPPTTGVLADLGKGLRSD